MVQTGIGTEQKPEAYCIYTFPDPDSGSQPKKKQPLKYYDRSGRGKEIHLTHSTNASVLRHSLMTSYKVYLERKDKNGPYGGRHWEEAGWIASIPNMVANATSQGGSIGRHRKDYLGRWFSRFLGVLVGECQRIHEDGWM